MAFYLKSHLFISSATSHPILRRSHHRSRHGNAPAPPMIIVFILVTSPVRARRATPSLTAFPPVPIPSPNPPNRASPPSVSPKIPAPHFHQISLPSALSPAACMILWNVMGWVRNVHAQYSATRNSMKRRAADGKLLSARVIHENESGPTPTKPTPPRFICALHGPEPKLTDT